MAIPHRIFQDRPMLKKGETLTIRVPVRARWPRFKAWIMRRPRPTEIATFTITAAEMYGIESLDEDLALWFRRTVRAGEMSAQAEKDLGFTVSFNHD